MTTILFVLTLLAGLSALVAYARNDHFGSGRDRACLRDELGRHDAARLSS